MSEGNSNHNHLDDLENELDSIYNTYVNPTNNNSTETLDSEKDRAPGLGGYKFKGSQHLPPVHISSRLSSMQTDEDGVKSAPLSPSSASSFDFNMAQRRYPAMTNSSLNVLVGANSVDSDIKDIITLDASQDGVKKVEASPKVEEEDWNEKGAAERRVSNGSNYRIVRRTVQDFKFGKSLGEGSYSTVVLATDKHTSKNYACKILDKTHIIREKKVKYVNIEKHALNRLSNRMGVISLYFTFQDKSSLYFVLDYASNGELLSLIKQHHTLNEDCVRHFGAQILDAIKYMHDNGVIHRDIKPENILLDDKLRIQITDFGTARLLEKKNDESEEYPVDVKAKSFVGTAEYVSPELLESKYCGKPGDIWAFGCIIYQMIAGKPPFKATNEYLTFQKITKLQFAFSAGFPTVVRDLIKQILVLQPSRRATIPMIQKHYFFSSVDFDDFDLIWYREPPEIGPYKMTAKSMSKVPELTKQYSQQQIVVKKANKKSVKAEPRTVSEGNGKLVNPASAAAFVLNKKNPSESSLNDSDSPLESDNVASASVATSRVPSAPEYIPGTNILRPTINTRASFRSSSTQKKTPKPKPKPKVMEVTPITTLEAAWGAYLKHPDERILKIGPVQASRELTESFERRHKGLLHNAPLGMANKMQGTRSSTSLLSQVVNGSSAGLRGSISSSAGELEDESDAVTNYFEIEEIGDTEPESSESNTSRYSTSALFKKLRIGHADKGKEALLSSDEASSNGAVRQHPLDKTRTCTLVLTTHGRTLIFLRTEKESNARLISEIKLGYPFVQIKELVSSGGKFQKMLPSTGVFAIESIETTFAFEVNKIEVNQWTEALARSKINQFERTRAQQGLITRSESSPRILSSPRLQESPSFNVGSQRRTVTTEDREKHDTRHESSPTTTPKGRSSTDGKPLHLLAAKIKNKATSIRRKPPPPIGSPNGVSMSTGLAHDLGSNDNGLQAAVLAVSNNSHNIPSPTYRRSSFTKEDKSRLRPPTAVRTSASPSGGVTSKNSKFLARSQRTK
ncbi:kinase-like protein [Suhomyces tanzawaensis NRRL Y-17324]|uniref:non-specific serine/threonine protein kinase n=1 Tax=Suhomyces tanzawaensis NRRL Y-17324 TaxID=984487 RepID=A0A1E4SFF3_9ASCO|nr:kinase-like protein [Suhomyces tanzawaensis NRRL Y-17324]ODV78247.1 kinase-like protein [Suhomyces tanzawaensis NRRL Y-17324]